MPRPLTTFPGLLASAGTASGDELAQEGLHSLFKAFLPPLQTPLTGPHSAYSDKICRIHFFLC